MQVSINPDKKLDFISRHGLGADGKHTMSPKELREVIELDLKSGRMTVDHLDHLLWHLEQNAIMHYKRVHKRLPGRQ